ncbi:hypothetical protein EXIGLDRAFT_767042 [Exidia glandulosa HHB12029]|uniref:F-box domain-containing protein n=1 Tax=Exidia glandulosa HHB12029 TaxID=1314781 RepID=A0A165J952_EXIGL|nr:hypothetical protein EXIGLDRAFT_767042 [Exidia glandulosa HHB12029]
MALRATDLLGVTDGAGSGSVESSPFTALPFELVAHIITAAARDRVLTSTRWVASLTLICRAIYNAVDPILVETLRITETNTEAVARNLTRFQRTQHINIVSLGCTEMETTLGALFWHHCSSLKAVTFVHTGAMLFSHHVLIMLRDRHKGNFDPVPYLHIRRCWLSSERPHLGVKGVPASITHLVTGGTGHLCLRPTDTTSVGTSVVAWHQLWHAL